MEHRHERDFVIGAEVGLNIMHMGLGCTLASYRRTEANSQCVLVGQGGRVGIAGLKSCAEILELPKNVVEYIVVRYTAMFV